MPMEVLTNPDIEKFIIYLETNTRAKVTKTIGLLEKFGHLLLMPHSRKVTKDLFELRIRGNQEIRIFYTFHKNSAHLLHGFIKKQQKIPRKEIKQALNKLRRLT